MARTGQAGCGETDLWGMLGLLCFGPAARILDVVSRGNAFGDLMAQQL